MGGPAIRTGRLVKGKWHVDARLGDGATATVYAATHRNGYRVALKVLHPDLARNKEITSRFLREGYVANTIKHPGIVRVLDDDTSEDGSVFLVMELLEGDSLEKHAARTGGRLPIDQALDYSDKLLDVLAAAHAVGVVHRDIKPENVVVLADGTIKVLDFGLAQLKAGRDSTRTGLVLGTPDFMSPEQASGHNATIDARADIYGVGATLFTLLSGQPVHRARSLHEHLLIIATTRVRPLVEAAPFVPVAVCEIVDRALLLEKSRRWSDARHMQAALRGARNVESMNPTTGPVATGATPQGVSLERPSTPTRLDYQPAPGAPPSPPSRPAHRHTDPVPPPYALRTPAPSYRLGTPPPSSVQDLINESSGSYPPSFSSNASVQYVAPLSSRPSTGQVRVAVQGPDAIPVSQRAPGTQVSPAPRGGVAPELDETVIGPSSVKYDASSGSYVALTGFPIAPGDLNATSFGARRPEKTSGAWLGRILILGVIVMTLMLLLFVSMLRKGSGHPVRTSTSTSATTKR